MQACTSYGGYMYNSKKEKSNYPGYDIQEEISFHLKANLPEKPAHSWIFFPDPIQYTWILSDSTIIYVADISATAGSYVYLTNDEHDSNLIAFQNSIYNKIINPWISKHHFYDGWDESMDSIFESMGLKKPELPSPSLLMS